MTYPTPDPNQAPQPIAPEAVMLGEDVHEWDERMNALMDQGARIITFRGAGTVNGIEPGAAVAATETLGNYVRDIAANGTPVALVFDGDADNRAKPDIGSIFGGLVDSLQDVPGVTAIAAQTRGWYGPAAEGDPIQTSTGTAYETYVFPDTVPGAHARLTQSEALVAYPNYEQVFVGPAGPIALNQLHDLSAKAAHRPAEAGPVKVTVIPTPNNPAVGAEMQAQLATADAATHAKLTARLEQRQQQPNGALITPDGHLAVNPADYPNVELVVAA